MTTNLGEIFLPIQVTSINISYDSVPITSLGSAEVYEHAGLSTARGEFIVAAGLEEVHKITSAMRSSRLYLTSTHNVANIIQEVEKNLAEYLTSPQSDDRELGQIIARLKGLGCSNKKVSNEEN